MTLALALASILVGALFFSAAVYLGVALGNAFSDRVQAPPDGPAPHAIPLRILLIAGAVLGAFVVTRTAVPSEMLELAIVCVILAAVWVTDARRGVVPDAFTLVPLGIVLAVALWSHNWETFPAVILPSLPFAIAALLSKGRGMGWGDVKLVALGSALLAFPLSIFAFTGACLTAVAVNYARGRKRGIIAFAPYLAGAIAIALPIGLWR